MSDVSQSGHVDTKHLSNLWARAATTRRGLEVHTPPRKRRRTQIVRGLCLEVKGCNGEDVRRDIDLYRHDKTQSPIKPGERNRGCRLGRRLGGPRRRI